MPKTGGKVPTRSYGQIIELELIEDLKKVHKPKKQFAYQIDVTWTDSSTRRVYRSYDQLYELYCSLTAITKDGGMVKLPGRQIFERSTTESFAQKHLPHIKHFVDSLLTIPTFMQQSDPFLWFWEPSVDDLKIFDIDRTVENNPKYPQPSATVLKGGTVIVNEDEQDYICVCTALNLFSGTMPPEHQDEKGLSVKEGDVIYVLRMSNCPSGFWQLASIKNKTLMVKKLSLATSTQELEEKAENVRIDEKSDEATLLRYIKSANAVYTNAESVYKKGDEEQAYIYFVKFFHVYSQLRSTIAYINKNKAVLKEASRLLPITKCKTALDRAEKLKKSLTKRYDERDAIQLREKLDKEEMKKLEEQRDRELAELERLKLEAAQPAVDAATLFNSTAFSTPLVPLGQSAKDIIPKEPYISAIELMHIIEAKMKVLLIDIRTLEEFKNSHIIHEAVIFLSKDYLDINTKLTSSEIRELILMKEHKLLWDKRSSHDVIVIFDSDSQYNSVAELSNAPINIVRECCTDCLDPNFINSDLPKVLDGGYASWVYHFPKHCTNPDRARKVKPAKAKVRHSAPASLLPLTTAKAAAIYPELNKDTEPKPLPPVHAVGDLTPAIDTNATAAALAAAAAASAASQQSVVTCGNVQISMPQSPQTIQINQWNQEKHVMPNSSMVAGHQEHRPGVSQHNIPPTSQSALSSYQTPSPPPVELRTHVKPSRSDGSLKITDIYEGTPPAPAPQFVSPTPPLSAAVEVPGGVPQSTSQPNMIREETVTTFPAKVPQTKPPDPIYAQVEVRRKVPSNIVAPTNTSKPSVEYADIRSIQPAVDKPAVDRSNKPKEALIQSVQPAARPNRAPVDLTKPPAYITQPQTNTNQPQPVHLSQPQHPPQQPQPQQPQPPLFTPKHQTQQPRPSPQPQPPQPRPSQPQPQQPRPSQPQQPRPSQPQPQQPRPSQPQQPRPSQPQPQQPRPQPTQSARPATQTPQARPQNSQPSAPVKNPTVNRVVKPLSARALEEKNMRMMPAFGSVQMGTCGLKNIGNTCFMNAVLQCLSSIAPLTQYFVSGRYKHEINPDNPLGTKGLVAEEYAFLVKAMWSDRFRHLAPKDWKEAIGRFRPQFLDYSQKDSQEFTSFMLDALHEDLNRVLPAERKRQPEIDFSKMTYKEGGNAAWECYTARNNSVIVDLFQGQFRNITRCLRCGYESVTFDTFMYLTVPVGKSRTNLASCIENFCQTEKIEWRCDKCHVMGDATKDITIWRLPTILVVILKRFSYTGMWRDKITTFVDFPITNFRAVVGEVNWVSNKEEGRIYRLFGVTNHTGTLEGGHYIGCARNPLSGDWFTYDDHVIRPMKADQTRKKEAYLLFYTSVNERDDIRQLNFKG